jgi:hypothetical protein
MPELLPSPEDPSLPEKALSLQLLLDQAPRALLKGMDSQWIHAYFDEISLQYAQQLFPCNRIQALGVVGR